MKIALVCVEDGLMSVGFRKIGAWVKTLNPDTSLFYVPFGNSYAIPTVLRQRSGMSQGARLQHLREIAQTLSQADMVGFSSMTAYAPLTAEIIAQIRLINPKTYIVWGGIHPIIVPEDAIQHADAICTGEGEFAFAEFFEKFVAGEDFTLTRNFWFRRGDEVVKNGFMPLMTAAQMDSLPLLHYGHDERIYRPGQGFVPLTPRHYVDFNGLSYNTVWSIGCPFRCTYCGNTKFIDNDRTYSRIRHPSVAYIVAEIKAAMRIHPHISTVVFHDDSFMALRKETIEEFSQAFAELEVPFCVMGVIPNYVREDKLRLLIGAGLNRVRMGIQNGSVRILKFYERPTPPPKILEAATTLNKYRKYMIPPAYDIIVDNPVETLEDVVDNLEFVYTLPRPYTLNVFSLRTIPNTHLEKQMKERNLSIDEISANYLHNAPTLANCLLFLMATFKVPRWLFSLMIRRAAPLLAPQPHYCNLVRFCRWLYLAKRGYDHLRFGDFSVIPGQSGYILYKLGLIRRWQRQYRDRTRELPQAQATSQPETQTATAPN